MQQSVENVFARSWELLTQNWVIIVPGVIVGIVVGLISGLVAPPGYVEGGDPTGSLARVGASFVSGIIVTIVGIAGYIVTQCYTAGMAGAAWARGKATLDDGAAALREDASNVFLAALGLFVVGIVAAIFALPTLGISLLAYYILFIYTIAAAVVGNARGFDALAESFRIARSRFVPTLIIALVLVVIRIVGGVVAGLFGITPLIGPIVGAIINQVVVAFATLVLVGEYLNLRGAPEPPAPPV
jgi:hypothetical protein